MIIRHFKITGAFFLMMALSITVAARPMDYQKRGGYEPHSGQSIFDLLNQQEVVEMTLVTELDSLITVRKTNDYRHASLTYKDGMGIERNYDLQVKPRGKFRRRVCDFPPLKLKFSKDQLEAAGLSKHNDLKLVTHCMDDEAYNESLVMKEYLVYKMYNELTPNSFRVQLVKITYQDKNDKRNKVKQYGFVIEDVDEMADRLGGKECDNCMGVSPDQIKSSQEKVLSLFQYMIGNSDFDLSMNRNVKFVKMDNGTFIPVPYDFDFSVLVGAPYLRPNSDLEQTVAMERIYMGNSKEANELRNTFLYFKSKRNALLEIIHDFQFLDKKARFEMELYVESFFDQWEPEGNEQGMIFKKKDEGVR